MPSTRPVPNPDPSDPSAVGRNVRQRVADIEDTVSRLARADGNDRPPPAPPPGPPDGLEDACMLTWESNLTSYESALGGWFEETAWSGTCETYLNGSQDILVHPSAENLTYSYAASSSSEVRLKDLTPELREDFRASDLKEWNAVKASKAVRVLSLSESQNARGRFPDRVLSSRIVRRLKPQPGVGTKPKAKSRWCVHGHQDPDTGTMSVYAPTPTSSSVLLFLTVALALSYEIEIADATNAFCQAKKLSRPKGPIYVEPCEGLDVPAGCLIELVAPVYGLDDAPYLWHETLTDHFKSMNYRRSLLEPCWYVKHENNKLVSQVLIDVDDLLLASEPAESKALKEKLSERFIFGKWESRAGDFIGRSLKQLSDRCLVNQEKYILENIHPVKLGRGRLTQREALLNPAERAAFTTLVYQINWVARETRPDVAGTASLLASKVSAPTVDDLSVLNKAAAHLRSTASQPLILWQHDLSCIFTSASDCAGAGTAREHGAQGAWIAMIADAALLAGQPAKASLISWRSTRVKRVVASTLAGETLALSASLAEIEWLQVLFRDVVYSDVDHANWAASTGPFGAILKTGSSLNARQDAAAVVDAKSVFDTLTRNTAGSSKQDKRTAIELSIVKESLRHSGSKVRWVPHWGMPSDQLTKADISKANAALEQLMRTGIFRLLPEAAELEARRALPKPGRSKRASARELAARS